MFINSRAPGTFHMLQIGTVGECPVNVLCHATKCQCRTSPRRLNRSYRSPSCTLFVDAESVRLVITIVACESHVCDGLSLSVALSLPCRRVYHTSSWSRWWLILWLYWLTLPVTAASRVPATTIADGHKSKHVSAAVLCCAVSHDSCDDMNGL